VVPASVSVPVVGASTPPLSTALGEYAVGLRACSAWLVALVSSGLVGAWPFLLDVESMLFGTTSTLPPASRRADWSYLALSVVKVTAMSGADCV
jgi:hypothetical protein